MDNGSGKWHFLTCARFLEIKHIPYWKRKKRSFFFFFLNIFLRDTTSEKGYHVSLKLMLKRYTNRHIFRRYKKSLTFHVGFAPKSIRKLELMLYVFQHIIRMAPSPFFWVSTSTFWRTDVVTFFYKYHKNTTASISLSLYVSSLENR